MICIWLIYSNGTLLTFLSPYWLSLSPLKDVFKAEDVDEILKDLDKGKDDQINFREFCGFVSKLSRAYRKTQREAKKLADKK